MFPTRITRRFLDPCRSTSTSTSSSPAFATASGAVQSPRGFALERFPESHMRRILNHPAQTHLPFFLQIAQGRIFSSTDRGQADPAYHPPRVIARRDALTHGAPFESQIISSSHQPLLFPLLSLLFLATNAGLKKSSRHSCLQISSPGPVDVAVARGRERSKRGRALGRLAERWSA